MHQHTVHVQSIESIYQTDYIRYMHKSIFFETEKNACINMWSVSILISL